MRKRILAAFLWFYAGWYGGALLANFLDISPALGPILGASLAFLIVGDPRRIIWKAQSMAASAATVAAAATSDGEITETA